MHLKKGFRIGFARLRFIAYEINENWSLDLTRVDKHSKQNAGVQYLLIAADCFSRYIRVEPLKSKFATTSAEAFKQLIKLQQPKYFCWMLKTSLRRFQYTLSGKNNKNNEIFGKKKSAFAKRNICYLRNIFYGYLEEQ